MFLKPFKVKSSTLIKGTDRKKLRSILSAQFTSLTVEDLHQLIPAKDQIKSMKIVTHNGDLVQVYVMAKDPIFFQVDDVVFPTVYTLWQFPDLVPVLATYPQLHKKFLDGAHLMLPGVVVPECYTKHDLGGNLLRGATCAVIFAGDRCPVAIGKTNYSSEEMIDSGMRGKGVIIMHVYQDLLWEMGTQSAMPLLAEHTPVSEETQNANFENADEKRPESEESVSIGAEDSTDTVLEETTLGIAEMAVQGEEKDIESPSDGGSLITTEMMDDLLHLCFVCALKISVKKADLPLMTSKLYRNHMLLFCPSDRRLDIKKTSFKKLSKFLAAMKKTEVITVKEMRTGVDFITEVDRTHSIVRHFEVTDEITERYEAALLAAESSDNKSTFTPPVISTLYQVNNNTLSFFKSFGHTKSTTLTASEIREVIKNYVQQNGLVSESNKRIVTLDASLCDLVSNKGEYLEDLSWNELYDRVQSKLTIVTSISTIGRPPIIKRGVLEPIALNVQQRAGNKKVTLVENLETYGIDPGTFSHEVQVGMACSCSTSPLPGKNNKGQLVTIQGNQIRFVTQHLTGKYQLHPKYIKGTEKAPKGRKR